MGTEFLENRGVEDLPPEVRTEASRSPSTTSKVDLDGKFMQLQASSYLYGWSSGKVPSSMPAINFA